jgi:hypothetical protein
VDIKNSYYYFSFFVFILNTTYITTTEMSTNEELEKKIEMLMTEIAALKTSQSDASQSTNSVITPSKRNMVSDHILTREEGVELDSYIFKMSKLLTDTKSVMFDGSDWLSWERIVCQDLIPLRLMTILTNPKPEMSTNYEKQKYEMMNMKLCNYLMVRLSPIPKRSITSCKSAYLIWQKLGKLYASTTTVNQNKLRDSWAALVMTADQTLAEWVQSVDYMAETLEAADIPVDDKTKLHRLLRGLSSDWHQEKRYFELSRASYEDVCLNLYEISEQKEEVNSHRQLVPAFQTNLRQNRQPYRPPFKKTANYSNITCFTCGGSDHDISRCPTGLKPSLDENGRNVTRCFNCLKEGHIQTTCKEKKRITGSKAFLAEQSSSTGDVSSGEGAPTVL